MPVKLDYQNAASTASMIYVVNNKFLAVERAHPPFEGMFALPGGFNDFVRQESLEQTAVRELFEETGKKATELVQLTWSSSPTRDPRGHVIDHIYVITKAEGKAKAGDDARKLKFFPLNELPYPQLAFDHSEVMRVYLQMRPYLHLFPKINMADYARTLK